MAAFSACYNDNLAELTIGGVNGGGGGTSCDTAGVMSYTTHVSPIMRNNCGSATSCHNASSSSGINLSDYNGVRNVALNGTLLSSITWVGSASHMPKNGSKMADCNIKKIEKWVNAGSLNN